MALCARATLLLGALQVLALRGVAAEGKDALGLSLRAERKRATAACLRPGCAWKVPRVFARLRWRRGNGGWGHLPSTTLALRCLGAVGRRRAHNLLSFSGLALQPRTQIGP